MSVILSTIQKCPPREQFGSWTSEKYDFQRHYSILLMIDLHQSKADYRIAFDYMDDIFVMTPSDVPARASFYQIKTSDTGHWTLSKLISRKSKAKNPKSIFGKMYYNAHFFGGTVDGLYFVSNVGFSLSKKNKAMSSPADELVKGCDLSQHTAHLIENALQMDFPGEKLIDVLGMVNFNVAPMNIKKQQGSVVDRLGEYYEKFGSQIGENLDNVPLRELTVSLYDTVRKKSGVRFDFSGRDDFYEKKTLCRSEVEVLLVQASTASQLIAAWSAIDQDLLNSDYRSSARTGIRAAAIAYVSDRAAGKSHATRFSKLANDIAVIHKEEICRPKDYLSQANILRDLVKDSPKNAFTHEEDLLGAVLVHVLEIDNAKRRQRRALALAEES